MSKMNIVNNAMDKVKITINENQIIIDLAETKIQLLSLKAGEVFKANNVEYIVLEHFNDGTTGIIRKECLPNKMKFGDTNNWINSKIRRCINDEYLNELKISFGNNNIIKHSVDLFSLDGLDDYGKTEDYVSLLTIDQYRKYRKVLGENMDSWWWLVTPDSTPSGYGADCVRCVNSRGDVDYRDSGWCDGCVRPFCILKSNIFVS